MKNKLSIFTGLMLLLPLFGKAQVTIGTNNPPDPSAILDLQSANGGLLFPRLTTVQRNAIVNPAIGLSIYNTDTDCLDMYFLSGGWKPVQCGCNAFPNATFNVTTGTINNPVTISSPIPNMTYSWSFQNGSPSTSSTQSTQVTWTNTGTFGVNLTLTDSAGCSASFTDSITISNCMPFTVNLTTCGKTGRTGPDQTQANSTYGPGVVVVNNGYQQWTVPVTGTYSIEVGGASPPPQTHTTPYNYFGLGAIMRAEFTLTAGTVLQVLVGQRPPQSNFNGGGGGTFVAVGNSYTTATPLIIAGGGGSHRCGFDWPNYQNILNASTSNSGKTSYVAGGTNGNGGACNSTGGASGAGFSGNGCGEGTPPLSFQNGGTGGLYTPNAVSEGGFGGGGQGNYGGSGGGGGYSGGGGPYNNPFPPAGGGGSYIDPTGTNVATSDGLYNGSGSLNGPITNLNAFNSSAGYVTITKICP